MLAAYPKTLQEWREKGEDFLKDRIGFRNRMFSLYRKSLYTLFREFVHPIYMLGKHEHLFYIGENTMDVYQSLDYTPDDVERIARKLSELQTQLRAQNIHFLFVPIPGKQSLYNEYLPSYIHKNDKPSLRIAVENKLIQNQVSYISLEETLLSYKKETPIHNYKFDPAHLNGFGIFKVHESISKRLETIYDNYPSLQSDNFTIQTKEEDLAPYFFGEKTEQIPLFHPKNESSVLTKTEATMPFQNASYNPNAPIKQTLLLLSDSYFYDARIYGRNRSAVDYYAHAFEHVYLFYNREIQNLPLWIAEYKPDIIIFEIVDWNMHNKRAFEW